MAHSDDAKAIELHPDRDLLGRPVGHTHYYSEPSGPSFPALERAVVEAAVGWYHDDGERTPLANAVETLIAAREEVSGSP